MLDGEPVVNWLDVRFDPWAARDAADACDRLAVTVADVASWSAASTTRLLDTWEGGLADEFVGDESVLRQQLATLHDELRWRAASLRDAADEAVAEQRRRERRRDEWWDWDHLRRARAARS